jgi:hypothetical protein
MRRLRCLAFSAVVIMSITFSSSTLVQCQQTSIGTKPVSFAVNIKIKEDVVPAGQKLWITLESKNISNHPIDIGNGLPWRLHVEREGGGEPPLTVYHRQLRGDPSVPGLALGGPGRTPLNVEGEKPYEGIPSGGSDIQKLDLTNYYTLASGEYTVYMEARDVSGVWLRTNSVQFGISAGASQR